MTFTICFLQITKKSEPTTKLSATYRKTRWPKVVFIKNVLCFVKQWLMSGLSYHLSNSDYSLPRQRTVYGGSRTIGWWSCGLSHYCCLACCKLLVFCLWIHHVCNRASRAAELWSVTHFDQYSTKKQWHHVFYQVVQETCGRLSWKKSVITAREGFSIEEQQCTIGYNESMSRTIRSVPVRHKL